MDDNIKKLFEVGSKDIPSSIPLFPLMNNSDVDFVVKNIKDLLNFGI